jgi:prefoldin subunit 5
MVSGVKNGKDMQSLNYNAFIGILVKEIQDLKKEITSMKENIAYLEKKVV